MDQRQVCVCVCVCVCVRLFVLCTKRSKLIQNVRHLPQKHCASLPANFVCNLRQQVPAETCAAPGSSLPVAAEKMKRTCLWVAPALDGALRPQGALSVVTPRSHHVRLASHVALRRRVRRVTCRRQDATRDVVCAPRYLDAKRKRKPNFWLAVIVKGDVCVCVSRLRAVCTNSPLKKGRRIVILLQRRNA